MKNPVRRALLHTGMIAAVFICAPSAETIATETPPTRLVAGSTLESLTIRNVTYSQVRVRTVTAQTVMIQHESGITSLRLRDLPPALQQRFGYDPDAAAREAEQQRTAAVAAEQRRQQQLAAQKNASVSAQRAQTGTKREETRIDQLLLAFGQPPEIRPKVDLRSRYNELGLWIKDQGLQPSCSVFAIVSALEFQSAELNGTAERFSEDYLLWATRKTLNRLPSKRDQPTEPIENREPADEGFSLPEVVTALRAYGILGRSRAARSWSGGAEPAADLIAEARSLNRVSIHVLPGRDGAAMVENIIQALNTGVPVPVGIAWPVDYNWRTGFLDKQRVHPEGGHAVTIVGYTSKTGRIEDTQFVFKNSYGTRWGIDGYGTATYDYLCANLQDAVVLELQPR